MEKDNEANTLKSQTFWRSGIEQAEPDPENGKIYPSIEEITGTAKLDIKENKIQGPYASIADYIDIHYKLLRADFILPIMKEIKDFSTEKTHNNIVIHENVQLVHCDIYKNHYAYKMKLGENSLQNELDGSLLIISQDNFKTALFGRLTGTDTIYFEGKLKINFDETYTLVECNTFFEPYYNSLKFLRNLDPEYFPMKKYIIDLEKSEKLPLYLPSEIKSRLTLDASGFNKSQQDAIKGALLNEFAVIQGPPGTGKTLVGIEIVKNLVSYSKYWHHKGPILVVCYTNHALDQFLEKLLPVTDKIVRLGGGCESKLLENYIIHKVRKRIKSKYRKPNTTGKNIHFLKEHMNHLRLKLQLCEEDVLYEDNLFEYMPMEQVLVWLLFEDNYEDQHELKTILLSYESSKSISFLQWLNNIQEAIRAKISIQELDDNISKAEKNNLKNSISFIEEKKKSLMNLILAKKDFGLGDSNGNDIWSLNLKQRWQQVNRIMDTIKNLLIKNLSATAALYREKYMRHEKHLQEKDIEVMRSQFIVGMTTTAASRLNSALEQIGCPIVIVEEAAEVLEAHIISSLPKTCQHLILIGDHQQLQPQTADHEIGDTYKLSVSLFERLILNDMPHYTLNIQHRMRPEISSLITPSIYPQLYDSVEVKKYERIRGLSHSVYFINHSKPEKDGEKFSKKNLHEAKFLLKLANHLILNGYKSDEITVVAAYASQVVILQHELEGYPSETHSNVTITTIDGYQGKQNRIILLSLVRNNNYNNIGFLKTSNRVCVALSRAQEGLIIMGNIDLLSRNSRFWRDIKNTLSEQNAIGHSLPLKCEKHSTIQVVKTIADFEKASCPQDCQHIHKCGHRCEIECHFSITHHTRFCDKCLKPKNGARLKENVGRNINNSNKVEQVRKNISNNKLNYVNNTSSTTTNVSLLQTQNSEIQCGFRNIHVPNAALKPIKVEPIKTTKMEQVGNNIGNSNKVAQVSNNPTIESNTRWKRSNTDAWKDEYYGYLMTNYNYEEYSDKIYNSISYNKRNYVSNTSSNSKNLTDEHLYQAQCSRLQSDLGNLHIQNANSTQVEPVKTPPPRSRMLPTLPSITKQTSSSSQLNEMPAVHTRPETYKRQPTIKTISTSNEPLSGDVPTSLRSMNSVPDETPQTEPRTLHEPSPNISVEQQSTGSTDSNIREVDENNLCERFCCQRCCIQ